MYDASNFNEDLSGWDVSNVTNKTRMFGGADSFTSDLSSWDVSNVTIMSGIFQSAEVLQATFLIGMCPM